MQHIKLWAGLVRITKSWLLFLIMGLAGLSQNSMHAQISGCLSSENLALKKSTEQSSTYGLGSSSLAVDGNQFGASPWSANLQHTRNEEQPWWQVDLRQLNELESITIFNRSDAFQNRLANFYVCVSSSPISPERTLEELLADEAITHFYISDPVGQSINLPLDIQGRYVRIQLAGRGVLHIAEVEVNGCLSEDDPCYGASPVEIDAAGPFLENEGLQSLSANPTGGTWGGSAMNNGTFDPSGGPGLYGVRYSYTDGNGCIQADSIEIPVIPVGKCNIPTNMALNQPTKQSSTLGNGAANLAVDGSRTGSSPWEGDLQHTEAEENPWWEVELTSFSQVDQVILFNRSDCCQSRLNNFYVLVSASPFDPEASLDDLLNNPNIYQTFFSGAAGSTEIVPIDATGRYVRIQLSGTGTIHLREVEVFGCDGGTDPCQDVQPVLITPLGTLAEDEGIQNLSATPFGGVWGGTATNNGVFDPSIGPGTYTVSYTYTDDKGCSQTGLENVSVIPAGSNCRSPRNLALSKTTDQSSTYGLGIAATAVDNNTSGSGGPWENAEIIHTEREDQPWWQVVLADQAEIHELVLFNRTDCCQDRLSDFYVLLSDNPFPPDASLSNLLSSETVSSFFFEGSVGDSIRIPIYSEGRFLRIQLTASNEILHMAEVQVWGCTLTDTETGLSNPFNGVGESLEGINQEDRPSLQIFPNPTASQGELKVRVSLPKEGAYQVSLYDFQGKTCYRESLELNGEELLTLPLGSISTGIYLIEVSGEDTHLTDQVWVQ